MINSMHYLAHAFDNGYLMSFTTAKAPGILHFQNIDDVANGKKCVASYDSDRVLYYDKDNRKKLVGVVRSWIYNGFPFTSITDARTFFFCSSFVSGTQL